VGGDENRTPARALAARRSIALETTVMRTTITVTMTLAAVLAGSALASGPWERTETRAECSEVTPLRRPLFGDLHVHTGASHDAHLWAYHISCAIWCTESFRAGASWICLLAIRPAKSSAKNDSDWRSILRWVRQRISAPIGA
jgi:hypothetical protein